MKAMAFKILPLKFNFDLVIVESESSERKLLLGNKTTDLDLIKMLCAFTCGERSDDSSDAGMDFPPNRLFPRCRVDGETDPAVVSDVLGKV